MSRRDIILVAALLNAGILSVLFMMAVKVDDSQMETQPGFNQMATVAPKDFQIPERGETLEIAALSTPSTTTDEWDKVLKDYAASVSPQTIVHEEEAAEELEKENEKLESINLEVSKAVATQPSTAAKSSGFVEVKVKRGDALEKIARSNGTTIEAIKKYNNLTSDKLSIGQTLKIPTTSISVESPKKEQPKTEAKSTASTDVEYYTIKSGDNPWKIAKQFRVKFDDLLKLNSLNEEKARNLKVGDKIRVK